MTILEALVQLRDDLKLWTTNNLNARVPKTRKINNKILSSDITLTASDIGLGNVGNFKAVSTVANQGLTDAEKAAARANIGAGASSFSGSYNDLTDKPTIPDAYVLPTGSATVKGGFKVGSGLTVTGDVLSADAVDWSNVQNKPTTFTPATHAHTASEVGAVPTSRKVNGKALSTDITLSASDVGAAPVTDVEELKQRVNIQKIYSLSFSNPTQEQLQEVLENAGTGILFIENTDTMSPMPIRKDPNIYKLINYDDSKAVFAYLKPVLGMNSMMNRVMDGLTYNVVTISLEEQYSLSQTTYKLTKNDDYVTPTDSRLSDARTPLAHAHELTDINGLSSRLVNIAIGSYYGTGTFGVDNPCTLSFDFRPSIVYVSKNLQDDFVSPFIYGQERVVIEGYKNFVTWNDNSVSWYSETSANSQLNTDELIYYVAIG